MMESAVYLVTREIAERSGLIESRYRTVDNRFILNDRDLSRIRFTTDEYIEGLKGVEKITRQEAKELIAKNNYKLGIDKNDETEIANEEQIGGQTDETQLENNNKEEEEE
jgi:hypothetical protein